MPIYQYNGQHYDIATDDPEEAKRKIMASLPPEKGAIDYVKDFGKSAASLADTALNTVTGTLDYAAYPVARAFGRSPEQATAETTSPKDVVGRAFGITQDPAYQNEASRRIMGGIGQGIDQYAVKPLTRVSGLPEQDVSSMVNSAMLGLAPVAGRAGSAVGRGAYATEQAITGGAQAVGSGVKTTAMAPFQAAKGAFNAATGGETALAPLGKTYVTPEGARLFREGKIDVATVESPQYTRPIGELPTGAIDRAALKVAGNQIPLAGKGAQAFGERVMSDYIANPYKAAVDIGLPFITGGAVPPIYALGRGVQAGADMRLAGKGFDPGLQQQIAQATTQQVFQPSQTPRLPYNPTPAGPVAPETMYATPGGQVGTNLPQVGQAALNERYPPYTPPPAPTPAQQAQAAAAARITQSPSQALGATAKGQEIAAVLEQRRQAELAKKQQRWAAAGVKLPEDTPTAPVAGPVTPTEVPAAPTAPVSSLDRLRGQLNPMTPEEQAAVDTYLAKTPADKAKATREANKRAAAEQQAAEAQRQKIIEQNRIKIQSQDDAFSQPGSYDRPLKHDDAMAKITWDNTKNQPTTVYGTGTYNNAPAIWKRNPDGSGYIETFTGIRNEPAVTWEFNKVGNNLEVKQIYHTRDQQITWENGKVIKYFDEGKNKLPTTSPDWPAPIFEDKLKQIKSPGSK